jgi:ABC-2 type transport system permease protein
VRRTYMALVIQQSDLVEKIESITEPTGLEYSITSLIEKMSSKIDGLLRLGQPIQVTLYLDRRLKSLPIDGITDLDKKVKEAVDKSNAINYDKLRFSLADPSEDKTAAVSAEIYGIGKLNWKGGLDRAGRAIQGGEAYLGIVLKNQDKVALIELSVAPTLFGKNVITGLDKLEDRINKGVSALVSSNPRIGYVTGHDEVNLNDQQSPEGGAVLRQVLSDVYEVKEIDIAKDDIPEDLGVIIINGPRREYSAAEIYKIDQFLMKGKAAVFFLDSFFEMNMGQQNPFARQQPVMLPVVTGLEPLLKAYGVSINKNIVLDASCAKGQLAGAVKDFYFVPIIKKKGFSKESVITKYLKGVAFIKASSVEVDAKLAADRNLTWDNLVNSSDESWQMAGEINLNPFFIVQPKDKTSMKKFPLAVLVTGKFDSYFKAKDVPLSPDKDKGRGKGGVVSVSRKLDGTVQSGSTRIIVVGTSEITRSSFLMNSKRIISSATMEGEEQEKIFANGFIIHSMVDYLAGNSFIPEMSSKSLEYNPLEKSGEGKKIALKTANIAGVPLLVIIAGLVIWNRRKMRKKRLMDEFSREVKHNE